MNEILFNGYDPIKRKLTKYRQLILEECKILYIHFLKLINENISPEKKIVFIQKYKIDFFEKTRVIIRKSSNEDFEFFYELIHYFSRRLYEENAYYELKSYIGREKYNFTEFYSLLLEELLKRINKKIDTDIENLVLPHIKKEIENVDEEKEQEKRPLM